MPPPTDEQELREFISTLATSRVPVQPEFDPKDMGPQGLVRCANGWSVLLVRSGFEKDARWRVDRVTRPDGMRYLRDYLDRAGLAGAIELEIRGRVFGVADLGELSGGRTAPVMGSGGSGSQSRAAEAGGSAWRPGTYQRPVPRPVTVSPMLMAGMERVTGLRPRFAGLPPSATPPQATFTTLDEAVAALQREQDQARLQQVQEARTRAHEEAVRAALYGSVEAAQEAQREYNQIREAYEDWSRRASEPGGLPGPVPDDRPWYTHSDGIRRQWPEWSGGVTPAPSLEEIRGRRLPSWEAQRREDGESVRMSGGMMINDPQWYRGRFVPETQEESNGD